MHVAEQDCRLTDPHQVEDVFVDGLGQIETVAGDYNRYVLFASRRGGGQEERVVVVRVIIPKVAVPLILMQVARHLGLAVVRRTGGFINGTMH